MRSSRSRRRWVVSSVIDMAKTRQGYSLSPTANHSIIRTKYTEVTGPNYWIAAPQTFTVNDYMRCTKLPSALLKRCTGCRCPLRNDTRRPSKAAGPVQRTIGALEPSSPRICGCKTPRSKIDIDRPAADDSDNAKVGRGQQQRIGGQAAQCHCSFNRGSISLRKLRSH